MDWGGSALAHLLLCLDTACSQVSNTPSHRIIRVSPFSKRLQATHPFQGITMRRGRGAQPPGARAEAPPTLADLPEVCLVRILSMLDSHTERWVLGLTARMLFTTRAARPPDPLWKGHTAPSQRAPVEPARRTHCSLPTLHPHPPSLDRARAGGVCKAFCAATRNPELWTTLAVKTAKQEGPGQVLNWLIPRMQHLATLDSWADFEPGLAAWGSMVAAALCAASTLRDLTITVRGELEVGAWITPLTGLTSVHLEGAALKVSAPRGCRGELQ